jgi:hypothetical protein
MRQTEIEGIERERQTEKHTYRERVYKVRERGATMKERKRQR